MRRIGRYALLSRLGSGHLGDVFHAHEGEEPDGAERLAVKVFRPDLVEDLRFSRALIAGAPVATAFTHDNAVRVLEIDRDGPEAFLAMPLLEGQPLSLLVQRARVDGQRIHHPLIAWIGAQIASTLHAAHQHPWFAGANAMLVHGALSPRSIFLTYDGQVKLLGLAIGRARHVVEMTLARLPYVAPELVKGAEPTPRSDLFSLGTLLYEAFSTRNIFRRANEEDTRTAIVNGNVPPLNSTNLDVDASIGDLIAEMMAPRIDARPDSLMVVADALETAAGDASTFPESLSLLMQTTFREERDAAQRMLSAATRAQSAVNATRPRAVSGIARVAGAEPTPDIEDDIPIDEGTPVSEPLPPAALGEWSTDVPHAPAPAEQPDLETATTIDERMPPELAAAIEAKKREQREQREAPPRVEVTREDPTPRDRPPRQAAPRSPSISAPIDVAGFELADRKRVARYRVEQVLARSATAVTFYAKDPNVGRHVVVKAFDPELATDARLPRSEWVRLFKREARLASVVSHPNLPTLFDAGRDESVYFVVYEVAEGETLAQRLRTSAMMSQSEVRRVLVAVAEGLAHLHARGIVHCDVRPSNVLVAPDGRVRLLDLSLAAGVDDAPHPLLASNAMALSPEYLDGNGYGPSSDQFALGMLLYQMLVGTRPFKGLDDDELVRAIRTHVPAPPEEVEPHVNPILSQMCMKMLAKDPSERFDSCAEIAEALSGSIVPRGDSSQGLEPGGTTDRDRAVAARLSVESIASAYVEMCSRVLTMTQPFEPNGDGDSPADAALAVARRLKTDEPTEVLASMAAAMRDLADRLRVDPLEESMAAVVPAELARVLRAIQQMASGEDVPGALPVAAEIAHVVEVFYAATRPRQDRERVSPRRAVLSLRDTVSPFVRSDVVAAFVEHLRETISALDLSPARADAKRVLLAGAVRSDALVHALEFDGYVVEEAADGHAAWEKLRHRGYVGAVLDAALSGRDGASLVRLCRAHPDTAHMRFVLVGGAETADLLAPDPSVELLTAATAVDDLRLAVSRLLGRP